jgi:hypothetical protein
MLRRHRLKWPQCISAAKSSATITGVDISGTNGTFSTSLKVGTNDVWHAGNFDPSSKLDASVQKYLSGVSGTCGGTITFAITNGTNITWNSAHTHAEQEAVTKVTALNSAGTSIGSYTASTSAGEVKIKAGTGITLGFSTDTITVNADHVPRSKVLTLNSSNSYSATFTHNYGSTNYVVLLGTDNPQRHVYYQKTANAVTVYLDDVPFASPTVEVSVMVQMATD